MSGDVARGAADSLDQTGLRTQKALLVGIEDRHQGYLRQVKSFTKQVHADQALSLAGAQARKHFDAFDRVEITVQVGRADAGFAEVFRKVLSEAFGDGRHQRALIALAALTHFGDQILDLAGGRANHDHRINDAGGADELLGTGFFRLGLVLRRRRTDEQQLRREGFPFLERARPVVDRTRQAEPVLDEGFLTTAIAGIHPADLRDGDVAFIDHAQEVRRKKVVQAIGPLARLAPGQVPRVILDALAGTDLFEHFEIVGSARLETLRFQQCSLDHQFGMAHGQFFADAGQGPFDGRLIDHKVLRRIDVQLVVPAKDLASEGVDGRDLLDLIAEEYHADGTIIVRRPQIDHIAAHAKFTALKGQVAAIVLDRHEAFEKCITLQRLAHGQDHGEVLIRTRRAEAVNARDAGNDQHIPP